MLQFGMTLRNPFRVAGFGRFAHPRVSPWAKFWNAFGVRMLGLLILLAASWASAYAQRVRGSTASAESSSADTRLFSLAEVRPGMKGTGRTVFSGSEPQEFTVEILGVLPGFPGPRQSAIIARLSGDNVAKTGVFAGMSGSPVFIDGRLVGAIAFSFPFAKEPICGITPIKQMIDLFESGPGAESKSARGPRAVSTSELASAEWKPSLPKPLFAGAPVIASAGPGSPMVALLGQQMQPIATPLVFSGISQQSLSLFSSALVESGLLPVAGIGGAAAITPLAPVNEKTLTPGASISVQLARGDYSIAASGTATFRDGDRIYAFGHPLLGLGVADMPMSESPVVTVIPSAFSSFKLAVPGQMVGAMTQDRASGVFGQLGHAPRMIPVHIRVQTSRNRTEEYSYEIIKDPFLTPLLVNVTVYHSITASERAQGDSTIGVRGQIEVKGQKPVALERRFSSSNAALLAAGSVAQPVGTLLTSGFDGVEISKISLDISSSDTKNTAVLERISLDRTEVRRGETIEIQAYARSESGKQFVERIPVQIPADVGRGQLIVFVGDGGSLQEAASQKSLVPRDLGQLVGEINKIKKNDRLYVRLYRVTPGVVIGASELPNLPPSVVATLTNDRSSGGYTPLTLSPVYEKELPPAEFVIVGQHSIGVEVRP